MVYKDDRGETKTKKLMSFANPATYATLKDAKNGELFDITQIKNDKGFWDWTSATRSDATGATASTGADAPATTPAKSFTPTKSSYETTEERARRQVLIVKQSSLATAERSFQVAPLQEGPFLDELLARAQVLTDWVLDGELVKVEQGE